MFPLHADSAGTAAASQGRKPVSRAEDSVERPTGGAFDDAPSETEIRRALERALSSPAFVRSPAISRFLRYVVEQSIAGAAEQLNAYAIAVEGLGRPADFDPQVDPLVRVTAGRLRQALARVAAAASEEGCEEGCEKGCEDGVWVIAMPVGSYAPLFYRRPPATGASATAQASAAVRPVAIERQAAAGAEAPRPIQFGALEGSTSADAKAARRRDSRTAAALAAFAAILVLAAYLARPPNPAPAVSPSVSTATIAARAIDTADVFPRLALELNHRAGLPAWYDPEAGKAAARSAIARFDEITPLGEARDEAADYRLVLDAFGQTGGGTGVHPDGQEGGLTLLARLERISTRTVVWSTRTLVRPPDQRLALRPYDIFGRIFAPILSPYGVLTSDVATFEPTPLRYMCVALAYQYFDREDPSGRIEALRCLDAMIASGVRRPTVYALKAFLHLEAHRASKAHPIDGADPLAAAREAAFAAIDVAPGSARALQALFDVQKVSGQTEAALETAARARAANPYDLDVLADVATMLISQGLLAEAGPLVREANRLGLALPTWFSAHESLFHLLSADLISARAAVDEFLPTDSTIGALATTLVAQAAGDAALRDAGARALLAREPDFLRDPAARLRLRGFSDDLAAELGRDLAAALAAAGGDALLPSTPSTR